MENRGEKRTNQTAVKREQKKTKKVGKSLDARKTKEWNRYRSVSTAVLEILQKNNKLWNKISAICMYK